MTARLGMACKDKAEGVHMEKEWNKVSGRK